MPCSDCGAAISEESAGWISRAFRRIGQRLLKVERGLACSGTACPWSIAAAQAEMKQLDDRWAEKGSEEIVNCMRRFVRDNARRESREADVSLMRKFA